MRMSGLMVKSIMRELCCIKNKNSKKRAFRWGYAQNRGLGCG